MWPRVLSREEAPMIGEIVSFIRFMCRRVVYLPLQVWALVEWHKFNFEAIVKPLVSIRYGQLICEIRRLCSLSEMNFHLGHYDHIALLLCSSVANFVPLSKLSVPFGSPGSNQPDPFPAPSLSLSLSLSRSSFTLQGISMCFHDPSQWQFNSLFTQSSIQMGAAPCTEGIVNVLDFRTQDITCESTMAVVAKHNGLWNCQNTFHKPLRISCHPMDEPPCNLAVAALESSDKRISAPTLLQDGMRERGCKSVNVRERGACVAASPFG